jgi:hypothetical protein
MKRGIWMALGATAGIGGALLFSRRASAASPAAPGATQETRPTIDLAPLPRAADVSGDLVRNWGETPIDLRPLFMLTEETARIQGAARVLAVIAYRESRFVTTAQNGNAAGEQDERDSSRDAYNNRKANNPPLRYGAQAAEFGSGGLFGALAPYFLWTGVPEVGDKAPLLNAPPSLVFQPRAAAFGAAVYMQRLLKQYRVDDVPDLKVGWANPGLLGTGRGGETYQSVRKRFLEDAKTVGIDLADTDTIPAKLDASAWPGVLAVFAGLVGALPKDIV